MMPNKIKNFLFHVLLLHIVMTLTDILLPNLKYSNRIRGYFIGFFVKKKGSSFMVASGSTFNMLRNLEVGNNVYIAHDTWINATGGLVIEDNVIISPKVVIATTRHAYENKTVSLTKSTHEKITIRSGSWIASNSVITMGVNIGKGSIIGACSVVTKNTDPYCFYAGQPAKKIRSLV